MANASKKLDHLQPDPEPGEEVAAFVAGDYETNGGVKACRRRDTSPQESGRHAV